MPPRILDITDRTADRIREMREVGLRDPEIAKTLCISDSTITRGKRSDARLAPPSRFRCHKCGGWNLQRECLVCKAKRRHHEPKRLTKEQEKLNDTTIEEMLDGLLSESMTVRTCNALEEYHGCFFVLELLHLTREELEGTPTFGPVVMTAIDKGLERLGLRKRESGIK